MRIMAQRTLAVLDAAGRSDPKSRIDRGDVCELGSPGISGLWPVTYPVKTGKKLRYLRTLNGFLVNQNDYAHVPYPARGYEKATVKSGGCGVCAAVMAVQVLTGLRGSVMSMADYAIGCGARVSGGTDMRTLTRRLGLTYGLTVRTTDSVRELEAHLKAGGCAVCNVAGRGMFSTGGHYMTVFGEAAGKLVIGDPGLYPGKYSSARRRAVTVCGELLLARPEVLDDDCVGRSPRFYLLDK